MESQQHEVGNCRKWKNRQNVMVDNHEIGTVARISAKPGERTWNGNCRKWKFSNMNLSQLEKIGKRWRFRNCRKWKISNMNLSQVGKKTLTSFHCWNRMEGWRQNHLPMLLGVFTHTHTHHFVSPGYALCHLLNSYWARCDILQYSNIFQYP